MLVTKSWRSILAPLQQQVKVLQSTRHVWGRDPLRAGLYQDYLTLLVQVRERIVTLAATDAKAEGPRGTAERLSLRPNGERYVSWVWFVPPRARDKFVLAFMKLYEVQYKEAGRRPGKRIVPFSTRTERTVRQARWAQLAEHLHLLRERYAPEAGDAQDSSQNSSAVEPERYLSDIAMHTALKQALRTLRNRRSKGIPPRLNDWQSLLSADERAQLARALKQTRKEHDHAHA